MTSPSPKDPSPEPARPPDEAPRASVGRILRHSSIYSLVPVLQQLLGLSLVRLYTNQFSDEEWGAQTLSELIILLVPQLVGVNLLSGMTRFYFDQKEGRDRDAIISSTFIALTLLSWLVCGAALLGRETFAGWLYGSAGGGPANPLYVDYWTLTLLIIPFSLSARLAVDYLVILQHPAQTTILRLGKSLGVIALNIWFVVGFGWGLRGFLAGILIGEIVVSTGFTVFLVARLGLRYRARLFLPMVRFSLPLLPVGLMQLGLHQIDRYLVKANVPLGGLAGLIDAKADEALTWTGIYGLGYKVGSLVHVALLGSFMYVWQPLIFGMKDDRERRETMVRVGTYAMISLAAVYLPVAIFGRQLVDLLAGKPFYRLAYLVAPWATISDLFYGAYAISQAALFQAKQSRPLLWINGSALALNIGLNLLLVPRMGIVGAAIATLSSFVLLAALGGLAAHRHHGLSFRRSSVLQLSALALACLGLTRGIDEWRDPAGFSEFALVICVKAALALAILFYLYRRVLDSSGRAGLQRLLRARLGSTRSAPGPNP